MSRLLRPGAVALALLVAAPAGAQTFEGLDLSQPVKKKKKKKTPKPEGTTTSDQGDEDGDSGTEGTTSTGASTGTTTEMGGFGLDLSSDTGKGTGKQGGKSGKKDTAPTMSFDAVDVSGKSADRQRLDAAIAQFKNEQYEQAALSAHELLQDPKMMELAPEAQYVLAKSLYRMGLYHSSLGQFSKLLARGPDGKFFKTSLEWLFFISHKTTNETVILDEIARYANYEFPEKFRNEFRYLLARYYFVRGRALDRAGIKAEADQSFEEVKRIVLMVPKGDAFYPRTKYLEALALFRNDKFADSLESLKDVVRNTRPSPDKELAQAQSDAKVRELAFMQLARTHYGHRQNRYAIAYYRKIERGTPQWLQALFESSWANYRVGQYEQALGNLITLSSPFFRDEYFPEAYILKAVIYFENCRYRESTQIVEDFTRIYQPVIDELRRLTEKEQDPAEYWSYLADAQKKSKEGKGGTDVLLERVLKLALTDADLKKVNDSILELENELDAYGRQGDSFRYSELAKELMEDLKAQRADLMAKAGFMAKSKLEQEQEHLSDLLSNGLRIKFETTNKEKEFLEAQLIAGSNAQIVKDYKYSVAVGDEELYWPYEGEYWRDELGTYQYTLTKGCAEPAKANRVEARAGGM